MPSPELVHDVCPDAGSLDPARAWASSGGMWLTGAAGAPPLLAGAGAAAVAEDLLRSIGRLVDPAVVLPTVGVLGERAALSGLTRQGSRSCGGASRILSTADGHVVLTLAREDDFALLPALVEGPATSWPDVASWAARCGTREAAERIGLLGLAGGAVGAAEVAPGPVVQAHDGAPRVTRERPRVLDLSSLWAGPLAARILGLAGADVVKVESSRRYDGARRGSPDFYNLLHAGHRSVVLDFDDSRERDVLQRLAASADVVIEASRPRALARLGLSAEALVASGVTWLSVTAHGRDPGGADRVGFGDDVAAGAGLVGAGPVFVADAVADPLTGLAAAAAALASLQGPRAQLLDVAMHRVAARAASVTVPAGVVRRVGDGWVVDCESGVHEVARPRARRSPGVAASPGADTASVMAEWLR